MDRIYNFKGIDFNNYPTYDGPLGVFYYTEYTVFKVWAPSANKVLLRLYHSGVSNSILKVISMNQTHSGLFELKLQGDWKHKYYTFQVHDESGWLKETLDPSVKATGIDGKRGMILDMSETNPEGWASDSYMSLNSPVDAVLYEMHVRDFSIHKSSNHHHKGKYLGVVEENTHTVDGTKTGLSHLLELGVTHVHLLPISDFYTVSEEQPDLKYNWGYDPLHYNSPEGWYATDPWNSVARIREVKQMVKSLHDHGLGVVLDVVYNHTGLINMSTMNQTFPGYFYRQDEEGEFSNASGCGNELATERQMVRQYIVSSLCYWAREYHIDGFRFDLMGIIDIETMNEVEKALRKINPSVILYGEGWAADRSPLPEEQRAVKANTKQLKNIASFSDDFRDAVKGNTFDASSKGFVTGQVLNEEVLRFGTVGAIEHPQIQFGYIESGAGPWANHPTQTVNYVSCHDNFTLYDKIRSSCPTATDWEIKQRAKLAIGLTFTAQGIPFIHSGVEFLRTKKGHHNTYKSSDKLNALDWNRKLQYREVFDFTRDVIALRKEYDVFRMSSASDVIAYLKFSKQYRPGTLFYTLRSKGSSSCFKSFVVCVNATTEQVSFSLPFSHWDVLLLDEGGSLNEKHISGTMTIPKLSMAVWATDRDLFDLFE